MRASVACAGLLIVLVSSRVGLAQRELAFSEQGTISVTPSGLGAPQSFLALGNIRDPLDPQNGLMPLAFDLADNPMIGRAPLSGDVVLIDPGGEVSDVWRFTSAGLLEVYSDIEPGHTLLLADVGIPSSRQSNTVVVPEASLFFESGPPDGPTEIMYMPSAGQPGYYSTGAPFQPLPMYVALSEDVPQPSTAGILAFAGVLALRRRSRTSQASSVCSFRLNIR